MKQHYLKPAEAIIVSGESTVTTVLGSCVSVTFFSAEPMIAAIIHGVLPQAPQAPTDDPHDTENIFKYVDSSILYIVKKLQAKGVALEKMEVKVFGGADVLGKPPLASMSVGRKNIASARATLQALGIDIKATDVGETRGRKLIFHTQNGHVFLKRLHSQADNLASHTALQQKISKFSA